MLSQGNPAAALALLAEVRGFDRLLTPEIPLRMSAVASELPEAGPSILDNSTPSVPSGMYMRRDSEGLTQEELADAQR